MTRRAKTAHGIDHRIEQAEEKETEIVGLQQFAFRATGLFRNLGCCGLHFGETLAEIIEKLPVGKHFLVDLIPRQRHGVGKQPGSKQYKRLFLIPRKKSSCQAGIMPNTSGACLEMKLSFSHPYPKHDEPLT